MRPLSSSTQATFNPELPAKVIQRVESDPEGLRDVPPVALRWPRWLVLSVTILIIGVICAALALISNIAGIVVVGLSALIVGVSAIAVFDRRLALGLVIDADDGVFFTLGLVLAVMLHGSVFTLSVMLLRFLSGWLSTHLEAVSTVVPGDPAATLLGFLPWAVISALLALFRPWATADFASKYQSDYITREEFHSTENRQLLDTLQRVTARAEHAHRVLGPPVGLDHALPLLRSQEWRLAKECLHLDQLRNKLRASEGEANTERLREALAPQRKVLERADEALAEEVARLNAYGRTLQAAVNAHDEWVKLQRIVDQADEFADLAARTPETDPETQNELRSSLDSAEAARAAREEMIQETARATSDLFSDTDGTRTGGAKSS